MNVIAAVPNYPPRSRVGAWLATHQFLRHLATVGHTVTAFSNARVARSYTFEGVYVCSRVDEALLIGASADVVVSHAGDGGRGLELADELGRPAVRMVHGGDHPHVGDAKLAVFNSEALRAVTEHDCESIVCHPPVHVEEWRTERTGDAVTIVNCSAGKGIKTAWRAADRLPHMRFLGVTGGYGKQEVPRVANFETVPTQPDMRTVYAQTRVLLMPSLHEAWGMVGVEAFCSGIPVIAHPTDGLRESLGPAGIFVDREDTDGWVREIERLNDPDAYSLASARAVARAYELDPAPDLERFTKALEAVAACHV